METRVKTKEELAVIKTKCDNDLLFFTRYFFKELNNLKFIVNWHHIEIVKNLQRVLNYELELLNINIPPRFSKTELAGVNLIARGIGMNPNSNFLYITASDELRAQTSVSIRDIVSSSKFKELYPIELKKDQNSKNLWRTTQGGGLKTATIFGQITGFGAGQMIKHNEELFEEIRNFEGCIILDDINKMDDAESDNANNEKVLRVLFNTILSRKNSADTPIINIQQRAGINDVTGAFLEHYEGNEKAEFMIMPVVSEDGVPLWEWKHNLEAIEVLRTSPRTSHVFQTQYMQNPIPREGLLFPKDELIYQDFKAVDFSDSIGKLSYIDIADTGEDNHCVIVGILHNRKIFVDDVLFTKLGTDTNVDLTAEILNKNNPEYVKVESNFGGGMYGQLLQPKLKNTISLIPVRAKSNKHARITQLAGFMKMNCVFRSDIEKGSDYDKFMRNIYEYTKNGTAKHDDAPDCLEGLCKMALDFHVDYFDDIPSSDSASEVE